MIQSTPVLASSVSNMPRARWWLLLLLLVAGVVGVALSQLDAWLRRTLEQQVATASQGRYALVIDELHTHLWTRTVVLRGLHLRPGPNPRPGARPQLPDATLDLAQLRVTGIGVVAALRRQVVPVDSLVLSGLRLGIERLPPSSANGQPLYRRLPLGLPGLRVGEVSLQLLHTRYGVAPQAQVQLRQATLRIHDLNLSAAGAADTTRLGYAAAVAGEVRGLLALAGGHVARLGHGSFSSAGHYVQLDTVRLVPLQPVSSRRSRTARVNLLLPRLQLTGLLWRHCWKQGGCWRGSWRFAMPA